MRPEIVDEELAGHRRQKRRKGVGEKISYSGLIAVMNVI